MNTDVRCYIENYSDDLKKIYFELQALLINSVNQEVVEKLWAKLPSYYIDKNFVRFIPFKDHVNIEAKAIVKHKDELKEFKITPKGMLQIYLYQDLPSNTLKRIFEETLLG